MFDSLQNANDATSDWALSGFSHCIKGATQMIQLVKGEKEIPIEIRLPIHGREIEDARFNKLIASGVTKFESLDKIIIEVSTLTTIRVNENILNSNYLENMIVRPMGRDGLNWWSTVSRGLPVNEQLINSILSNHPIPFGMTRDSLEVFLRNCTLSKDGGDELFDELKVIKQLIKGKELILVSNNDHRKSEIHDLILNLIKIDNSIRYFNPKIVTSEYYDNEVYSNNGKDINHYSDSFKPIIGEEFIRFVLGSSKTNME